MTYIEFFDKEVVDNFCACLSRAPEKIIFMGDNKAIISRYLERFRRLLDERGWKVELEIRGVNRNKLSDIIEVLSDIVENEPECVFELTGGTELYLIGLGAVCERYPDKNIQMQRYNVLENKLYDCDDNGKVIADMTTPALSVTENVNLFGGEVAFSDEVENGTYRWRLDDDFIADIKNMWDICLGCTSTSLWNAQIQSFGAAVSQSEGAGELSVFVPEAKLEKHKNSIFINDHIVSRLEECGMINNFIHNGYLAFDFKNEQVKRCLTKAGQALEMIVYALASEAADENGEPVYNDVMNGVYMQWNATADEEDRVHVTDNEIDVMMMRGVIPVFVSCKNGFVDIDELYKLNTVAGRFGGRYAKRVLVASALPDTDAGQAIRQRASEMRIELIEPQNMTDDELKQRLASCWNTRKY